MSIHSVLPVNIEPVTVLTNWGIFKDSYGDLHFCGQCYEGRCSSSIVEFDNKTLTGSTRSGRKYKLKGPSGLSEDASYVVKRWININEINAEEIVWVEPKDVEYMLRSPEH